ncbi:MAG: J domain-containing protein, partial [Hyphomicrobiaceae bacterium]|nr:J domain-containing protein [Hyphomicrobiaceae bacterium]
MRDPYSVLGVPRTADEAQIKKAFRTLAKKYHPDSNAGDASAKERFSEASNAYEFLSDKDKRGAYDRGEIDADGHPKFAGFQGFEGFRAGGARGGRPGGGTRHEWATGPGTSGGFKPEDILSQIFGGGRADAFAEARQRQPGGPEPRPQRGGDVKAKIAVTLEQIAAREKARVSLPTGKTLEVALPPKVADGQTIRLKGQGHAGPAGA